MRRATGTIARTTRPPSKRSSSATPNPARSSNASLMAETALPAEAAALLRDWIGEGWTAEALPGDASFRRYFRVHLADGTTRMLAWYPVDVQPQLRRFLDAYSAVKPTAYVPTVTHKS